MELYHHGVKGQKWGVRNYQNTDGTYTEEGKERRRKVVITGKDIAKDTVHTVKNLGKEVWSGVKNSALLAIGGTTTYGLLQTAGATMTLAGLATAGTIATGAGVLVGGSMCLMAGSKFIDGVISEANKIHSDPKEQAYQKNVTEKHKQAYKDSFDELYRGKKFAK